MFDAAQQAGAGRMPRAMPLVVGQQSLFDVARAPEGKHTLYVYARVASDPGLSYEQLGDAVEERIEEFAPGFRGLILGRSVRSPRQLEDENPSLVGGDLAGGSLELDQQLVFRPMPELIRYRTPLRGLYVAGASVHPGPAVHGASGAGAAHAVLADSKRRRRQPR
jgi:phytoene dehydrogenase-like protein